ncbi:MAG: hypothetical protein ACRDLF_06355 [Solirubrobacteraceae bacterium]
MAAVIHVFCQTSPSFATSLVNGLLAAATALGGCMAVNSGLLAAISLFVPVKPEMRANAINIGVGIGFMMGMACGPLMLIAFIARLGSHECRR